MDTFGNGVQGPLLKSALVLGMWLWRIVGLWCLSPALIPHPKNHHTILPVYYQSSTAVLVCIVAVNQPINIIKNTKNIKAIFVREIHFLSFKHGCGCFSALSCTFHCAIGASFIQVLKNYQRYIFLSAWISGSFDEIWKRKYSENLKLLLF